MPPEALRRPLGVQASVRAVREAPTPHPPHSLQCRLSVATCCRACIFLLALPKKLPFFFLKILLFLGLRPSKDKT